MSPETKETVAELTNTIVELVKTIERLVEANKTFARRLAALEARPLGTGPEI